MVVWFNPLVPRVEKKSLIFIKRYQFQKSTFLDAHCYEPLGTNGLIEHAGSYRLPVGKCLSSFLIEFLLMQLVIVSNASGDLVIMRQLFLGCYFFIYFGSFSDFVNKFYILPGISSSYSISV